MLNQIHDSMRGALLELDQWLFSRNKKLEIALVGAIAVATYTHEVRFTQDIDTAEKIEDLEILDQIRSLSKKHELPTEWLSDRASTFTSPDGMFERLKEVYTGQAIQVMAASREDLIALKAAAYVNRGAEVLKDYEDLQHLKVTRDELDRAIEFVKLKCAPPVDKNPWKAQFEQSLKELRGLTK